MKYFERFPVFLSAIFMFFLVSGYDVKANAVQASVPKIQFSSQPKTIYEAGDIVYFNLHAPQYSGKVQYRVVLWRDEDKSYRDLWTTGDRYYKSWQPYGREIFNLHWLIDEPGHYRITIYAKRAGVPNSKTLLKGMNCDSFMDGIPFEVANPNGELHVNINEDTPLLLTPGGAEDERYAVSGKVFNVYGQSGDYFKIKMGKTYGYIPASKVSVTAGDFPESKITLGWMYIHGKQYNKNFIEGPNSYISRNSAAVGIDAVSPTWFDITGSTESNIDVLDKADRNFTAVAHRNGYEVWARLYEDNPARAKLIFSNASLRTSIINKIAKLADDYNLDGVNIDFEGLGLVNKDGFTAFVAQLSQKLKEKGLTVSVDITKPAVSSYNFYDRAALSKYSNYMILMAYDEHTSSLKEAGSVSSYPWAEKAVADTINLGVPKNKLLLAVPFYTFDYAVIDVNLPYDSVTLTTKGSMYSSMSLSDEAKVKDVTYGTYKYISTSGSWYRVEYNGTQAFIPTKTGSLVKANTGKRFVIGSETMKMQAVEDRLTQYNGMKTYDPVAKQNVGEYYKDGLKHVVWIEDKDSMAWRMDLLSKYGLKGAAAWQLYMETPDVLDLIISRLK